VAVGHHHPLDITDRGKLNILLDVLESFRLLRATMPLQYVVSLLLVATDEGRSVGEYAARLGVSPSVMSRHLLDIGVRNRHFEEGFGLVEYRPDPMNLRAHQYYLTARGRTLAQQIIRQLNRVKGS
jgi:DNA-binding MarR family transcriptional regulator